ncbi:phage tail protein [Dasania sp. GY-MA-18]|uniref:Phage tail protein n=1 Tax=Dasania phycosphaerae TaxID=2950436 RepID=A0A9J6RL90_9GAMM|nr:MULTISPECIES: phage tail protein [Dasania]MCR8922667.1 phage tail protein [Dasania sp. GY-MA-18]MCZ0865097.1 phage tail protein [Dasania phycosphaerae]MCZ0868823.1 phage tail protein [Dasania phycosphaerae]
MADPLPAIDPSYSSAPRTEYETLVADFGDGYEQRAGAGLNSHKTHWQLVWVAISKAEADQLKDFLDERGGHTAFAWTPPGELNSRKWVCKGLNGPKPEKGNLYTLSISIREVFDL